MKQRRVLLPLVLILIALLFTGCATKIPSAANVPSSQSPAATLSPNTVNIEGYAFSPTTLSINKGDTVTWVNNDSVPHTASGTAFDSKTLEKGQSYSFTFTESGTFKYQCNFHPSMKGEVVVK